MKCPVLSMVVVFFGQVGLSYSVCQLLRGLAQRSWPSRALFR